MNKCFLVGHLGNSVELRHTSSGQAVGSFRLATNESWTKDGNKHTRTEWHRCVAWGKTAELCAEYLTTGSQVLVEGKLQTRQWDDRDGNKRSTTEVIVERVEFLSKRDKNNSNAEVEETPPPVDVDADIPF